MVGDGNHFEGIETIVGGSLILECALGRLRKTLIPSVGCEALLHLTWVFMIFPLVFFLLFFPSFLRLLLFTPPPFFSFFSLFACETCAAFFLRFF